MLAITLLAGIAIMSLAIEKGDYIASGPSTESVVAVVVLLVGIWLFMQGVVEGLSARIAGVSMFLVWVIPFFAMMIAMAAFEEFEMGMYIGQPCPPISLGLGISWMLETTEAPAGLSGNFRFLPSPDEVRMTPPRIVATGTIGYALAATLVQIARVRRRWSFHKSV